MACFVAENRRPKAVVNGWGVSNVVDVDVVVVGAGPAGLMLAAELRLAGVRPLVLERRLDVREVPRANGLGGQILELLHYRGVLERLKSASTDSNPVPRFPFGGVQLDLTQLADPPLHAVQIPQPRLERLLGERAGELGAEVRRGHEVVAVRQDDATVTVDVLGPDGEYQLTAGYVVGCDGARSRVRDLAGIPFPGTTYPEVQRLGQVGLADSVTQLDNGDLDVPGVGRIPAGYTRTDRAVFALGSLVPGELFISTTEDESTDADDDDPMTVAELQDSIRRVLGVDLPLGAPIRLSRYTYQARQAEQYRDGRILLAGDAAHLFPATGIGLNAGMLDAVNLAWKLAATIHGWAPTGLLDTYHDERRYAGARVMLQTEAQVALRRGHDSAADALREVFQELVTDEPAVRRMAAMIATTDLRYPMPGGDHPVTGTFAPDLTLHNDQGTSTVADLMHQARPVFLDLADRPDLREAAREWADRIDIHTAKTADRPAEALLIRPDAHIAWAATPDSTASALREALTNWFGAPLPEPTLAT
ncbi:FAD-dependent monooxygenase [Kribbella sancticallisti]|uniref:FAD-dependent monooxygenase n=1 Tax=Kribbella sancticallisti TaxID=460087 RepID=A0ABN2DZI3_9ACTN